MAPRASLPAELFLDAIVIYPERQLAAGDGGNDNDYGRRIPYDQAARERAMRRQPYVALRWVLNPALGIPLGPFTVWRRPAAQREAAEPINGWHQAGAGTFEWDGVTEMLRIEIDLTAPATITGLHRNDSGRIDYFTTAYFHRPEELRAELEASGLHRVQVVGVEGPGEWVADFEARWGDEKLRADLLEVARRLEAEPSIIGMSAHLLGVGWR